MKIQVLTRLLFLYLRMLAILAFIFALMVLGVGVLHGFDALGTGETLSEILFFAKLLPLVAFIMAAGTYVDRWFVRKS